MDPELLSKDRRGKSDSGRREQGDVEKKVLLLRLGTGALPVSLRKDTPALGGHSLIFATVRPLFTMIQHL